MELAQLSGGREQWVICDSDGELHVASLWLSSLVDMRRSPNTIKQYGSQVTEYLNWTANTSDWRRVNLAHLRLWMRTLSTSDQRNATTVTKWMTALRSFYSWAEGSDLLLSDVERRMTQMKYFPPGTASGGEHGKRRQVLVPELRPDDRRRTEADPQWIESADARERLETLQLNHRDRLLVDLMYVTGIRVGEALSLFTADLHFGGGSAELRCNILDGHFHIRMDNPTENGARAKGKGRVLFVSSRLVDLYVDYIIERDAILGARNTSKHVFVNLYGRDADLGRAMTYWGVRDVIQRVSRRIDYPLSGPHMLRHTFGTRLARGIEVEQQPLDVIQELLGHRDIGSTRVYTHGLEPAKRAALDALQARSIRVVGTSE
ncbi:MULTISPECIES: tyrosine-type recombinase/integrase [unclassified Microbacterium]|uniref:tyrosine-type recombinase/integrase n=1 Tax=unclassified Microbacterium TaxID=2609290 RepID=UPI001601E38F|nr:MULTISPECIES: tyrosine-type recombinase/integrase [unclassified Microbacterium]MBT2486725.1 tyrosine-type recombinase/integrase [Microbacterium sp. ISL-108]